MFTAQELEKLVHDDSPTASGVGGESSMADRWVFFRWLLAGAASVLVGKRGDRAVFGPAARAAS